MSRKPGPTVEGSVFYRERMMLPPGSVVTVELIDIAADLGAEPLGSQVIAGALGPPFRFSVSAGAAPDEAGRMALQALIVSEDGEVLWVTDSPVVVGEEAEPVEVMVRRGGFDGVV